MKTFKNLFPLLLFLTMLLVSCEKDELLNTNKLSPEDPVLVEASNYVDARVAELTRDVYVPPVAGAIASRTPVELPAGSVNALVDALSQVPEGGTLLVKSGIHIESGTVLIDRPIQLIGEPGAAFYFDVELPENDGTGVSPALHLKNASGSRIQGLTILPSKESGSMGILLEQSHNVWIADNSIADFNMAIYFHNSNKGRVYGNTLSGLGMESGLGVSLTNGTDLRIRGNDISMFTAGIFPSGDKGIVYGNELHDNYWGFIACKLGGIVMPDGQSTVPDSPTTKYVLKANNAVDNAWGYVIIDGAFRNYLFHNMASGNSVYDMELAGETNRFGAPVPTSSENYVSSYKQGFTGLQIKDCGEDNVVIGGDIVDTSVDLCY